MTTERLGRIAQQRHARVVAVIMRCKRVVHAATIAVRVDAMAAIRA